MKHQNSSRYQWLVFLTALCISSAIPPAANAEETYDPVFWNWFGSSSDVSWSASAGFGGIGTFGAEADGSSIEYHFYSPTLEQQDWAWQNGDWLSDLSSAAHSAGLKVMVDMEGANPWHWPAGQNNYTSDILRGMVEDLHNGGADRWFDECFDRWSDWATAIADRASDLGMDCQSGNDPMHLYQVAWNQAQSPTDFPSLYRLSSPVSMYFYNLRRDRTWATAQLGQHGALAYGFAKTWGLPTAMVYTINSDWGIDPSYWRGVFRAVSTIEALQFRIDDFMLIGAYYQSMLNGFDINQHKILMDSYVQKQRQRPVMNIVVHLDVPEDKALWIALTVQADAVTWGAFQAGYDIKCSTTPIAGADAYFIVTRGYDWENGTLDLTSSIKKLFAGDRPVFLQCLAEIPSAGLLTNNWKSVLNAIGFDASAGGAFYGDMPSSGIFKGTQVRFTGDDTQDFWWKENQGTRIPPSMVTGEIIAGADVPHIIGSARKYLITPSCLHWQASSVIAGLLSGYGVSAQSDVWGIAGPGTTVLVACSDTDLSLAIPGMGDGSTIHVIHKDAYNNLVSDETVQYQAPYTVYLDRYDSLYIDTTSLLEDSDPPDIPGSGTSPAPISLGLCQMTGGFSGMFLFAVVTGLSLKKRNL